MSYCLDTNTCIFHLNKSASTLTERLKTLSAEEVLIPSMVVAELLHGAEKSAKREPNLGNLALFLSPYRIISFDQKAARIYASIRAELERKGPSHRAKRHSDCRNDLSPQRHTCHKQHKGVLPH